MIFLPTSARRIMIRGQFNRLRSFRQRQAQPHLTVLFRETGSVDKTLHYENKDVKTDELKDVLNDLGMSASQWKIRESTFGATCKPNSNQGTSSFINTGRIRRRRNNSNGRLPPHYNYANSEEMKLSDPYFYNNPRRNSVENEVVARLKVNSIHAATAIDLTSVLSKVFSPSSNTPAMNYLFGKTKVIVELHPIMDFKGSNSPVHRRTNGIAVQKLRPRFVAIFRYGSIVFFNIPTKDANSMTEEIIKHSTDPVPAGHEKRENFEVAISPNMLSTAHVNADFATVKELDSDCVAVISTIMGQTVAFDSYNDTVDELLAKFADINSTVKKTGNFTSMERGTLFKVVAQNNSLFIDMIAKLGIKDRSDTAWNLSQYERIYEEMKTEFEMESRFKDIQFKLNLIQQNTKFFLKVLDTEKSNTLEWVIIVLISFECILMIMEMSGIGPKLFDGTLFNILGASTGIDSAPDPPESR